MSEALIQRLKESRANIWEQGKALLDKAEAEGRDLNAEEASSWQKINSDIDAVDQRVKGLEDVLKRDAEMVETFAILREHHVHFQPGVNEDLAASLAMRRTSRFAPSSRASPVGRSPSPPTPRSVTWSRARRPLAATPSRRRSTGSLSST